MSDKPPASDLPPSDDASDDASGETSDDRSPSESASGASNAGPQETSGSASASGEPGSKASPSAESLGEKDEPDAKKKSGAGTGNVPSEKAPPSSRTSDGDEDPAASPAASLKGLQKGEEGSRRSLLARSKRLQSMITSNRPLGVRNMMWAVLAVLTVIVGLLAATGQAGATAQSIASLFRSGPAGESGEERTLEEVADESDDGTFSFAELTGHPDQALSPYFAGAVAGAEDGKGRGELVRQFRRLADQYVKRYGEDDNFSMRLTSGGETDSLLEVFTFEEERQKYIDAGRPEGYDWGRINNMRRSKTRDLVNKWVSRGVPREPIRVKWGMADITRESRQRDRPFIEYEVRLARYFGQSLLMTEIGTKETFNQDELVSSVNAKSRYQLMPALLSEYGLGRYRLPTSAGSRILVAEEQHPLFSMEPAFKHASASINAMGHEIPGISAYHTGVNNIYNEVLVKFLRNADAYISPTVTTADAYLWGVTEGFDIVTRNSSFGQFSRTYVVGAYAALKAAEQTVIDTSDTMLADRVQLAEGKSISLDDLLTTLAEGRQGSGGMYWKTPDSLSLYNRFRQLNKHFHLPIGPNAGTDSSGAVDVGVPERGNVQLTATTGGQSVRFFLPPGARRILRNNDRGDLLDESATFVFNHDTYPDPAQNGTLTEADRAYIALIDDIRRFGFTNERRQELKRLAEQFDQMASGDASHYRRAMQDIIAKHRQFWRYPGWQNVAQAVESVLGRTPVEAPPAEDLPTQPLETPENANS